MSCVNIKHPEFIELTKALDLHPNFLEPIIHAYQNSSIENKGKFPSIEYIKEYIQGESMLNATEKHREVWKALYSEPKVFNTEQEVLNYVEETSKLFDSKSITTEVTLDGRYRVKVAEPIIDTDNSGEFSTTDNNIYTERELTTTQGFSFDARLQSLYNKQLERGNLNLRDILSFINENSDYYPIIKMLSSEKKNRGPLLTGVNIKIDDSIATPSVRNKYIDGTTTRRAYYDASTKTIHINAAAQFKDGKSDSVIIHEILHAITVDKILNNPKLQTEFENIIDEYLNKNPDERVKYGKEVKHRIEEFIADVWSNIETINKLKNTKSSRNIDLSIWDRIKNFFIGIFKDMASDSLFAEASVKITELLDDKSIIFKTKAKGDYFENESRNNYYLEQSTRILSQIDNLFSSNIIPSSEVRAIANKVAYFISDLITEIQTKPGFAASKFGETYANIDFSRLSRVDIVRYIGIDNIVLAAKQQFHPSKIDSDDRKIIAQARLLQKNWEAIMQLAGPEFSRLEKFNITSVDGNLDREILEEDTDGYNEESITQETEGSTQEHWQIENRTIEIVNSLSQEMRSALLQCYILAPDGFERGQRKYKKVQDKWGINERIPVKDAVNSILRWTQGSITLNDMISKLKEKRGKNPWISQIISRLEDTSGKEADFQSQFFSVFDLHFQAYSVGTDKDGKYIASIVNENPALKEVMDTITVLYNMGGHPLFTPKGIDKEVYNSLHITIDKLLKIDFESYDLDKLATLIQDPLNNLGYSISSKEVLETLNLDSFNVIKRALKGIDDAVTANLNNKAYQPFAFKSEGSIRGYIQNLLQPFTDKLEDITVQTTYSNGKMYQGYVTPSYLSKLMLKFKQRGEAFDTFIQEEYGDYEWFKKDTGDIETGWRNLWLKELVTDTDARDIFKHTVNLSWNGKYYMRNMSDMEYLLSVFTMYFSSSSKKEKVPAWFRVPMMSNKPSSEYIRFYSYRGANYKDTITYGLKMVFDQELSRIQTVLMRNYDKSNPRFIKNFDKNGKKFNLLTYMNDYLEGGSKQNTELGKLIQRKIKGEQIDEVRLNTLAIATIKEIMETKAKSILEDWKNKGIIDAAKNITNIPDDRVYESLENFIWNDTFAAINIMELTITDPAYYKDAEDIQKRFAQIHAPGVRGNKDATDYNGERVSDGKERTIYLTDFDDFKSNIIENLKIVFDRKIAEAPENQKEQYKALKESIIKQYEEINVADAQAYNSPTSYRKKAFIFGKWSRDKETVYERLMSGDFSYSDIQEAFQPLKPFKYTQMSKESHVENAPMSKLKVPVQNKNAEYLLVLAGAILQGQNTGKPNLLRAIYTVMKESAEKNPTKGIDTVQFTSAVKSGEMGAIDIKQFYDNPNGEALALAELRTAIYNADGTYNIDRVHETSFEDYCLQQEVPPHFLDHEQIHGSQVRYIVLGDLETSDYLGNTVTYNVEGRQLTADEFKAEYEQTIAENIKESIEELARELNITGDRRSRNLALSQILQKEIASSPRYGVDLMLACSLDENWEFRLPLGDPTQAKRIEQLINSIIKNRVNKQTITGGPVVQVSNFGTSRQLNIKFKDKNGNIIDRSKFTSDEEYKEYLKENQAGVAYFECFAPAYTKDIFLHFTKENGDIDIEAIEKLNPELLKMVGYRIPTENKYSIIPMKIVGFLPKEAGDGIMLPNDITLITGSDFDVDKMYLIRKDIPIKPRNRKEVFNEIYENLIKTKKNPTYKDKQALRENINIFLDNHEQMRNQDALFRYMWDLYKKIGYEAKEPTSGRRYRNNKIADMTFEVMTHETTADKMLNPGGFTQQKKMGYMIEAYRRNPNMSWTYLEGLSIDELKDLSYTDKNLTFIDTHVDFYKQNSAAASLIGIFAVSNIAHIILQDNGYQVDITEILEGDSLEIMGTFLGDSVIIDSRFDKEGNSISKTTGSLVASSADAVKDPVLNLMNINIDTVNVLNTLIRLGIPFDKAAMFLSQKCISNILAEYNKQKLESYMSLSQVIVERLNELEKEFDISITNTLNEETISEDEVIDGIRKVTPEMEYKTLKALNQLLAISKEVSSLSMATRFNSMSSAVGPQIIDNLITEAKLEDFSKFILDANGNTVVLEDIFKAHPILKQFSRTLGMANHLLSDMPANSPGFRQLLNIIDGNLAVIKKDRKLMSKLSDFYQSYLLVQNGIINPKDLEYYITKFPINFFESNYKEKYPNNPFIQAIKLKLDDKTGLPSLVIDTTGMRTEDKEILSSGWADLYKEEPEIAIQLFEYNFFKGGMGYTPKTFMHLLPMQIKEAIEGYKDTYNNPPTIIPSIVLDQFIRNNYGDFRLVPTLDNEIELDFISNDAFAVYDEDAAKMKSKIYIKTRGKDAKLFRQASIEDDRVIYVEVDKLGNNGSYLEIDTEDIETSIKKGFSEDTSNITYITGEDTVDDNQIASPNVEQEKLDLVFKIWERSGRTREQAEERIENYKSKSKEERDNLESSMKAFMKNMMDRMGLKYDEETIDSVYKMMC